MRRPPQDPYNLELLLDYVDGILDRPTLERIEAHLRENENSRNIVEGILLFYEQHGHDRAKLEAFLARSESRFLQKVQARQANHQPGSPATVRTKSFVWIGLAASMAGVLLLGYLWLNPSQDTRSQVSAYLEQPYESPVVTRNGTDIPAPWVVSYRKRNYQAAGKALDSLIRVSGGSPQHYFYAGLSKLYQQPPQANEAITYFQQVLSGESLYTEQARWYISLAYLLAKQKEAARTTLQEITAQAGHFRRQEATELLEEL